MPNYNPGFKERGGNTVVDSHGISYTVRQADEYFEQVVLWQRRHDKDRDTGPILQSSVSGTHGELRRR